MKFVCPHCSRESEIPDKAVMAAAMSQAGRSGRGKSKARPTEVARANALGKNKNKRKSR